mmetsp:Transcript_21188/g.38484  ORF Transcript_21188/g.38484 Transcript_21188/m.38484 type:complete len:205 (-) Transcript_21188:173-787(-)
MTARKEEEEEGGSSTWNNKIVQSALFAAAPPSSSLSSSSSSSVLSSSSSAGASSSRRRDGGGEGPEGALGEAGERQRSNKELGGRSDFVGDSSNNQGDGSAADSNYRDAGSDVGSAEASSASAAMAFGEPSACAQAAYELVLKPRHGPTLRTISRSVLKWTAGFPKPSAEEAEAMRDWCRTARPLIRNINELFEQWPELSKPGW